MNKWLLLLVLAINFPSLAAPKDYQYSLMTDSVSLLDMMVFRTQNKVDSFVNSSRFKEIHSYELRELKLDWFYPPEEGGVYKPSFHPEYSSAKYNFSKGIFEVEVQFSWSLDNAISAKYDDIRVDVLRRMFGGILKNSKKNVASLCSHYVSKLAYNVYVEPFSHSGYSTSNTDKLPDYDSLIELIEADTVYSVKINSNIRTKDKNKYNLELKCSTSRYSKNNVMYVEDIYYGYSGPWENLTMIEDELVKSKSVYILTGKYKGSEE